MNPLNYKLKEYSLLPIISQEEVLELSQTRRIAIHNNLIVDWSDFDHPGYNHLVQDMKGKDVSQVYHKNNHSFNADLIVCHKTIGKLKDSERQQQGRQFYIGIKQSQRNIAHEAILQKIDFTKPIYLQVQKLTAKEKVLFTQIPKFFKNNQNITLKKNKTFWDKLTLENAYFTSYFFGSYFLLILGLLFYSFSFYQVITHIPMIPFGYFIYTIVQLITHRYDFHHDLLKDNKFGGGDFHHAFPSHVDTISVQILTTTPQIIIIGLILRYLFGGLYAGMIILGSISGILYYNILHTIIHFGPITNIKWIEVMRRHHLNHHFKDQNYNFGTTIPIWDYVIGTNQLSDLKVTSKYS